MAQTNKKVAAAAKKTAKPVAKKTVKHAASSGSGLGHSYEVDKTTFMNKAEAARCAALGIITSKIEGDPDDMPFMITAGKYITNWSTKESAVKLANNLADFVERSNARAVKAATKKEEPKVAKKTSKHTDDDDVVDDE